MAGASYAQTEQLQKASAAIDALVGDYAARPMCGQPSEQATVHRAEARLALAEIREPGLNDVRGATPLEYAVIADDLPAIQRFAELGYPFTSRDGTLLFEAAMFATRPTLEYLLTRQLDVNATNSYGATALMVAAEQRRPEIVRLLLNRGADPAVLNRDAGTALTYALACGFTESARALIDGGATIDEKSRQLAERAGIMEQLDGYRRRTD